MIYTIKTLCPVDRIKEQMSEHAQKYGLKILKQYELKAFLQDKGFPIEKEITVFEFCNPPGTQQVLSYIDEVSVYIPYRISLYENDGITKLSTHRIDVIVSDIEMDAELKAYLCILFYNLKGLMSSWN